MEYPCIPIWMKEREKDPFDYPLRSLKEMALEQYIDPPLFTTKCLVNNYTAISQMKTMHVHKSDNRNNEIRFLMRIEDMKLSPLQKKRLIFLLGPRYKNDGKVKIVMRKYTSLEENFNKALEVFQQLYWEAKRAPMRIWAKMNNKERRRFFLRVVCRSKGPLLPDNIEEIKKKSYEEFIKKKKTFEELYETGQYTPQLIFDNIEKILKTEEQEKIEEDTTDSIESKIEKENLHNLAKEKIEQNLVKQKVLTQKAYNTFFKNSMPQKEKSQNEK